MIDIHCHILPGVDDGSQSVRESLKMMKCAMEQMTTDIIATPHSYDIYRPGRNASEFVGHELEKLRESANEEGLAVRLHPGEEILFDEDLIPKLRNKEYMTLSNSDYVLVEFMPDEHESTVFVCIDKLVKEGYKPIIAHPERYMFVYEDRHAAYEMRKSGAYLQINSQSLFGMFGSMAEHTANRLVFGMEADFIAGDAHSPYMRSTGMIDVHELISEEIDFKYAEILTGINPSKIIGNEKIDRI